MVVTAGDGESSEVPEEVSCFLGWMGGWPAKRVAGEMRRRGLFRGQERLCSKEILHRF